MWDGQRDGSSEVLPFNNRYLNVLFLLSSIGSIAIKIFVLFQCFDNVFIHSMLKPFIESFISK